MAGKSIIPYAETVIPGANSERALGIDAEGRRDVVAANRSANKIHLYTARRVFCTYDVMPDTRGNWRRNSDVGKSW